MKKIIFVLGIVEAACVHITEGSAYIYPNKVSLLSPPSRDAGQTYPYGTPLTTVRNMELADELCDIDSLTQKVTELQKQMTDLSDSFAAVLSSRERPTKKAASTKGLQSLNYEMNLRFKELLGYVSELKGELEVLFSRFEKLRSEEEDDYADRLQRLSQTVDRRLDCLGLYIRISMLANEAQSLEIRKIEDMVFPALKEMKAEIDTLKAQNAQLRQEVSDLIEKLQGNQSQP
ncbi:MAG: hypothetical protein K6C34_03600 [Alphaproteobacteria bacterium]|nr:hypothetical protein [Alphaproteobacteria bacterium]